MAATETSCRSRDDALAFIQRALADGELVTVRDGKVTEMVVYPTVDEALVAAGLSVHNDTYK